ncbi:MAG: hypothetical protein AAB320_06615, partial [Elusimicrobiota bacterium]
LVDEAERPDVHARYRRGFDTLVAVDGDGHPFGWASAAPALTLAQSLSRWSEGYRPAEAPSPSPAGAVWTGAVGGTAAPALDTARPLRVLTAVLAEQAPLSGVDGALELLLYAAREWDHEEAAGRLRLELAEVTARQDAKTGAFPGAGLAQQAHWARLLWDAHALSSEAALGAAAAAACDFMLKRLYDAKTGAFRHLMDGPACFYADSNAKAALALQRAVSFPGGGRFQPALTQTLVFLQTQLFDPELGMVHAPAPAPRLTGFLADNAWSALAFSESFLMTGQKSHREFADALIRTLFQDLWERDRGGFLDRAPRADDVGLLRQPRLAHLTDNGAALESLWRLHHLKGNMNYRRWLEWALKGLLSGPGLEDPGAAPLVRLQDFLTRGRMELELVGRPGDPAADALLAELHRHYLPRRIVSFVDPDDQDYILAHKLQAPSYPRLFGCVDFRAKADAAVPQDVPAVLKALKEALKA